jgi:hypothetical protein
MSWLTEFPDRKILCVFDNFSALNGEVPFIFLSSAVYRVTAYFLTIPSHWMCQGIERRQDLPPRLGGKIRLTFFNHPIAFN